MITVDPFKAAQPVWIQEYQNEVPLAAHVICRHVEGKQPYYVVEAIHENDRQEIAYETLYKVPPHTVREALPHKYPMFAKPFSSVMRKIQPSVDTVWQPARAFLAKRPREYEQDVTDDEREPEPEPEGSPVLKAQAVSEAQVEFTDTQMNLEVELDREPSPAPVVVGNPAPVVGGNPLEQAVAQYEAPVVKPGEEAETLPIVNSQEEEGH
jgi:hypothetical protein